MTTEPMTSANLDDIDRQASHEAIAVDRSASMMPAKRDAQTVARLRALVVAHHALVWRSLRRFGVSPIRVDEAVSRVFDVLVRRLDEVEVGKEAAFLVQVCIRTASELRRADKRRAQIEEQGAEELQDAPSPEELFERREARALLDRVLDELDPDSRAVFVLHELEQMTLASIATLLEIPLGTAKSRHRRGREQFERAAEELRRTLDSQTINPGQGAER